MSKVTIAAVEAKIKALCVAKLSPCYLHVDRHWGGWKYTLRFTDSTDELAYGQKLEFDTIQAVADWLEEFERDTAQYRSQP